jgi:hypothetical protein
MGCSGRGSEGVFDRLRDPKAAAVVKIDVDRFPDVRLGRDELHLEARGKMKSLSFFLGCARARGSDVGGIWILGSAGS